MDIDKETKEIIICVDCGQEEEISDGWYRLMEQQPDIKPPKRCYSCRKKKKEEKGGSNKKERW